ncbi:signal peptidase I [Candidatus Woesearchaeota archaeon]|nr:signal peptidase I [Candidatus Woesearchaeota archaeon]
MQGNIQQYLKRFWQFVWHEDSLASWIVSVLIAFILVKFIIYPGLGLIFDTKYPVVAVVSGSMEHGLAGDNGNYVVCGNVFNEKNDINFDSYWNICGNRYLDLNISKEQFSTFRFKDGFNKGDVMVVFGTKPKDIKIGDVILFKSYKPEPIIHRVVLTKKYDNGPKFRTKGDHNADSGPDELSIDETRIVGRAVLRVPYVGYVKIMFIELLRLIGIGG